jgi:hypothetical protein
MDLHADIFPDVFAPWDGVREHDWMSGCNKIREKVSLDPCWRPKMKENDVAGEVTPSESKETTAKRSTAEENTTSLPQPSNTTPAIPAASHASSSTASQPSKVEAPPSLPSSSSTPLR